MKNKCELGGSMATEPLCVLIERFVQNCLPELFGDKNIEVSVALVDNEEIHDLNKTYRNVDAPTDVLSFEDGFEAPDGTKYLGDIIVSVPYADSDKGERPLDEYILFLVAHGLLHLTGLDHVTEEERLDMIGKGEALLNRHAAT